MKYKLFLNNYFPKTVRLILIKVLLFFLIYKFIFSLDLTAIHYPLTEHVGKYSTKLLNIFTEKSNFTVSREYVNKQAIQSSQIYYNEKKIIYIENSCNGFIAFLRYIYIILCFPSATKRKFIYILFGLLAIHILNVFRCAGLGYINLYYQPYFRFAHDYLFKGIIYGSIFILWVLFLRKTQFQTKTLKDEVILKN